MCDVRQASINLSPDSPSSRFQTLALDPLEGFGSFSWTTSSPGNRPGGHTWSASSSWACGQAGRQGGKGTKLTDRETGFEGLQCRERLQLVGPMVLTGHETRNSMCERLPCMLFCASFSTSWPDLKTELGGVAGLGKYDRKRVCICMDDGSARQKRVENGQL